MTLTPFSQLASVFLRGLKRLGGILVLAILAACSGTTTKSTAISTDSYGLVRPLKVCSGYGCKISDRLTISQEDAEAIAQSMKSGSSSAVAERAAIGKTIALMERISRQTLRYRPDVEFSYQKNAGKRGQMDCVDESFNTITYLRFLQDQQLLKFHKPISTFAERGLLLDGRYPHKSARMRETGGVDWAVDSWKREDGAEPEIIKLSKWYKGRNDASQY